jgi:hypothetical protein
MRFLIGLAMILVIAMPAPVIATERPNWANLKPIDLTADVASVTSSDGSRLSMSSGIQFGCCSIRVEDQKRFAINPAGSTGDSLWIDGLTCFNPVLGDRYCRIKLMRSEGA